MPQNFYRFKRTQVESISALKGTNSWYAITDEDNQQLFACHVIGGCLGGTSTFQASREDEGKGIDDHRPLVAAMILLLEQSIFHDQAT